MAVPRVLRGKNTMTPRGHGAEASETRIETGTRAGFSALLFPSRGPVRSRPLSGFAALRAEGGPDWGPPLDPRASAVHCGTPPLLENAMSASPLNIAAIG